MKKKNGIKKMISQKKSATVLEYMALITFFIACLLIFERYIAKSFFGQWKKAGDVFSQERQYDPRVFGNAGDQGGTLECYCEKKHLGGPAGTWVPTRCADANCDCTLPINHPNYPSKCVACLQACVGLSTNLCGNDPC